MPKGQQYQLLPLPKLSGVLEASVSKRKKEKYGNISMSIICFINDKATFRIAAYVNNLSQPNEYEKKNY